MKKNQFIPLVGLFILAATIGSSCKKSETLAEESGPSQTTVKTNSVADHIIETGMTLAQINAVIAGASSGQTVYVQPGTYNITGKIVMKAGVTVAKQSTSPVFSATASSSILQFTYSTELNSCKFDGITFWNIRMLINNASNVTFQNCTFDYGKRAPGTNKTNNLKDSYIDFVGTSNSLVSGCTFSHRSTDPGRGVWMKSTTNAQILNNTFGNGGTTGYFVCAINNNAQGTIISGNTINRNTALNSNADLTDHGMYAHSFTGLTISNNTVSGWPTNAGGGSIKARNGSDLLISGNTLNGSGILLYEYVTNEAFPYLNNVVVSNNNISGITPANDLYHGIGYYRDNPDHSEYSIRIADNTLPNGCIYAMSANINVADFNAAGGGVYNNDTATGYVKLKSGIINSGNY